MTVGPIAMPRGAKRYEDLRSLGGAAVMVGLAWALGYTLIPDPWGLRVAIAVSILSVVVVIVDISILNWRLWRYFSASVVDGLLTTHTGRLLKTETSVRRDAVLSVDVQTGPLLGRWNLARLKLNGIASFPEIPPLAHEDVLALQRALTHDDQLDLGGGDT